MAPSGAWRRIAACTFPLLLAALLQRGAGVAASALSGHPGARNVGPAAAAGTTVTLARAFGDHMVLQHDAPCVWGWATSAAAGTPVEVHLLSPGQVAASPAATTSVLDGARFRVCLPPQPPGGPFTLRVTVLGVVVDIADVLFGEVWLASGQSNMAFTVPGAFNSTDECAAAAGFPSVRVATVAVLEADDEQPDLPPGGLAQPWARAADPGAICGDGGELFAGAAAGGGGTSAVAWFFARDLHAALRGVPIGVLVSTVGGTKIEQWSSAATLSVCPPPSGAAPPEQRALFRSALRGYPGHRVSAAPPPEPAGLEAAQWDPRPSKLYNAMIAPLTGVSIAGAIWYQGESNAGDPYYDCRIVALIANWRAAFAAAGGSAADFPFLFVQITPYADGGAQRCLAQGDSGQQDETLPQLRLAQTAALLLPRVGMAGTADLGDTASPYGSIHPRTKQAVGRRLCLEARRLAYGEGALLSRGPSLAGAWQTRGGTNWMSFRLRFDAVGDGLAAAALAAVTFGARLNDTSRAPGTIVPGSVAGDTLEISLAWDGAAPRLPVTLDAHMYKYPIANVWNSAGLPLEPFSVPLSRGGAASELEWRRAPAQQQPAAAES